MARRAGEERASECVPARVCCGVCERVSERIGVSSRVKRSEESEEKRVGRGRLNGRGVKATGPAGARVMRRALLERQTGQQRVERGAKRG